jgi:hypothetical protein
VKDLYKTELFRLGHLRNRWKPAGALRPEGRVIPENILMRPPTAELERRQAAPGVKVTPKNFGRDRRYPITNRFRDAGTPLPAPDVSLTTGKPAKSEVLDF